MTCCFTYPERNKEHLVCVVERQLGRYASFLINTHNLGGSGWLNFRLAKSTLPVDI